MKEQLSHGAYQCRSPAKGSGRGRMQQHGAACATVKGIPNEGRVANRAKPEEQKPTGRGSCVPVRQRSHGAMHLAPRCMALGHMLGKKFLQPRTEQTPSRSTTQYRSRKKKLHMQTSWTRPNVQEKVKKEKGSRRRRSGDGGRADSPIRLGALPPKSSKATLFLSPPDPVHTTPKKNSPHGQPSPVPSQGWGGPALASTGEKNYKKPLWF